MIWEMEGRPEIPQMKYSVSESYASSQRGEFVLICSIFVLGEGAPIGYLSGQLSLEPDTREVGAYEAKNTSARCLIASRATRVGVSSVI